jgi:membrane-associated phospholipid phosphatase
MTATMLQFANDTLQNTTWTAKQFLLCSAAAWLGLAVAIGLHTQGVTQLDLFLAINTWAASYPPDLWATLTMLGDTKLLLCLMSPLILWHPQILIALVTAIPVGGALSLTFKRLFDAPRPADLLQISDFHVVGQWLSGNSFPSGHTLSAFAAAAALWVCVGLQKNVAQRYGIRAIALILACLVGLSRIAVGAHWPFDVLAGASFGWLAGLSGAWISQQWPRLWQSQGVQWALILALWGASVLMHIQSTEQPSVVWMIWLATACVAATLLWKLKIWRV